MRRKTKAPNRKRQTVGFFSKGKGKNRRVIPMISGNRAHRKPLKIAAPTISKNPIISTKVIDHTKIGESIPLYEINSNISTKDLQEAARTQHNLLYELQQKAIRGEIPHWEADLNRRWIWKRQDAKKPNLSHLVYRRNIGHYGGDIVIVPEEHFEEFKSHFPKREWPRNVSKRDVRTDYTAEGEANFRKQFPNSNFIYWINFAHGTKAEHRLEFMDIGFSD